MSGLTQGLEETLRYIERDGRRGPPRWSAPTPEQIKKLRQRVRLSQDAFAESYGFSVVSLRKWEQGRAVPEQTASLLLRMIAAQPRTVRNLVDAVRPR